MIYNDALKIFDFEEDDYLRENMKHIDDSTMVSLFDIRDALNTESLELTYKQKRDIFHVLNEWKENEDWNNSNCHAFQRRQPNGV
tara:strand:+ start:546 stop:800 length:255 start_codon:yes stop_codon:yes gene_type:complete